MFESHEIAVPREISAGVLESLLKDLKIVFDRHPNKVLVLVYPGLVSEEVRNGILQHSGRRVFVFGGTADYPEFLANLLKGNFGFLDRLFANKLFVKANELFKQSGRRGPLGLANRLQSSMVTAPSDIFAGILSEIPRQFKDENLNLTAAEKLSAHITLSFAASGKTQAETIRKAVSDYLIIRPKNASETVLALAFNPARLDAIRALIQAASAYREMARSA